MKAVIFDMDGVIVDTEPIWIASKQKMLEEQGVVVEDSYHYSFFGTTLDYMWSAMKKEFNIPLSVDECILRGETIRAEMMLARPPQAISGVIDFISCLYEAGIPLAIASSSSKENILKITRDLEIKKYFQVLVSSEECDYSKPFPDVFLKASKELGYNANDCLIIEDATNGVTAAKAAGGICFGFSNPQFPLQDLSLADLTFSDFSDLTIEKCKKYF